MHARDIFTHLPAFSRLSYLQLNEVTGEALLNILNNCPILSSLVLQNVCFELLLNLGSQKYKCLFIFF